jgi:hypothetical protein
VPRVLRAIAVAVALFLAVPAAAHANGDPASDVLLTDTLFVPYQAPSREQVDKLRGVIDRAREAGQPVRVAIIHSPRDLGAVPALFGHPREYAELLRGELVNPVEPGARGSRVPLLVVMAAGLATGNVPPEVDRKLRGIEVASEATPDDLVAAAGYGVQELAKANGKPIPATFSKPDPGGGGGALTAILIVIALAAVLTVLIVIRVRGRAETDR